MYVTSVLDVLGINMGQLHFTKTFLGIYGRFLVSQNKAVGKCSEAVMKESVKINT